MSALTEQRDPAPGVTQRGSAYHYTTAEGLHGILRELKIRLTDVRFLNDRNELAGRELLTQLLRGDDLTRTSVGAWAALKDDGVWSDLAKMLNLWVERANELDYRAFVACFCSKGDLLSQWRGYAAQGAGYAIGFDWARITPTVIASPEPLGEGRVEHPPSLWSIDAFDVTYGDEAALKEFVEDLARTLKAEHDLPAELKAFHALLGRKDIAFGEEAERRLSAVASTPSPGDLKFRSSPTRGLIPYVEARILPGTITDIVVGPTLPAEAEVAVRDLLRMTLGPEKAQSVEVWRSGAPYR